MSVRICEVSVWVFGLLVVGSCQGRVVDGYSRSDASVGDGTRGDEPTCSRQSCNSAWVGCLVNSERSARRCYDSCTSGCVETCGLEGRRAVADCKHLLAECVEAGPSE